MFDGYDIVIFGVSIPWLFEEWNLTNVEVGAISSYSLVGMMVGAFIFSILADKLGKKNAIIICIITFSVFTLAAGLSPNPTFFTVMRFISALGMGGIQPILISLMSEYSPKKNRAFTVAAMFCGYSLGGILASLIGMFLIPIADWRIIYFIGIVPLITLPFFIKYVPESLPYYIMKNNTKKIASILTRVEPNGNYLETDSYQFASKQKVSGGSTVKKLFENKRTVSTLAIWVTVFSILLMVYGLNTWLPRIMQESGYGLTSSLSFNLVLCVGQVVGSLLGGYIADRIGYKKVLISLFAIGAVCFVSLILTSNLLLLYILIMIGGACTAGTMNLANPFITEFYPIEARATGMGWALGFGRIGAIIAPMLVAFILTMGVAPQNAFLVFSVSSLIGIVALSLVKEKYGSFDRVSEEKAMIKDEPADLKI
jgi:AAHS family benzoate transporter-like MFS transporter